MQAAAPIRTALAAKVYNRSIYLRVQPMPETLSERRAVLRMLQRSGEVEVFKKLRRDDSFITVMRTSKEAIDLVRRAPIRYELVVENTGVSLLKAGEITAPIVPIETDTSQTSPPPTTTTGDAASPGETPGFAELQADEPSLEDLPPTPEQQEEDGMSPKSSVRQRSFVLSAFITNRYSHSTHIRRSPLHGPWPREKHASNTFMTRALRELVPRDHDLQVYSDWFTGDQLNESRIEEHDHQMRSGVATTYFERRAARRDLKAMLAKKAAGVERSATSWEP